MTDPLALARPEIRTLKGYEHAAWDTRLERLHANELPWRNTTDQSVAGLNRYPEPHPAALITKLAAVYEVPPENALACRGSDEAIDLIVRCFCTAGRDRVVVCPPTFGMYGVAARIQGAEVVSVALLKERGFSLDVDGVLREIADGAKIVFLCTPNNPTGNIIPTDAIRRIVAAAAGRAIVVIDEAYVEFADTGSFVSEIPVARHLVVLRTLSKAFGLAGARIGILIADAGIVGLLAKVIPPYAIAQPCIEAVGRVLEPGERAVARERVATIVRERSRVAAALAGLARVSRVWPSAANFLLVEFRDTELALSRARESRLLLRDFRSHSGLESALRITIGSPEQNDRLIASLA